ncbi:unnamed protein product [Cladocopium goreaui]|uniref:Uncharacterized protein n=1 Tax=Cladocopium goreaui TaxID=2562237 RepID=A0A9P1CY88_9DINO|nr:unnamed protein product [Cladocopium goreaui]
MFFRAVCLQHSPGDAGRSKVGRKYHATTPATCSESGPLINCLAWGFQHCPLQMKNKHSAALRRTNFCTSLEQKFLAIHRLSTLEATLVSRKLCTRHPVRSKQNLRKALDLLKT